MRMRGHNPAGAAAVGQSGRAERCLLPAIAEKWNRLAGESKLIVVRTVVQRQPDGLELLLGRPLLQNPSEMAADLLNAADGIQLREKTQHHLARPAVHGVLFRRCSSTASRVPRTFSACVFHV